MWFFDSLFLNDESARVKFWSQIVDALPSAIEYCVVGDLNMIEESEDRLVGSQSTLHGIELGAWKKLCQSTIHGTKLATWERLCSSLRVVDVWHQDGLTREQDNLFLLCSDGCIRGIYISHIDKMYVSDH